MTHVPALNHHKMLGLHTHNWIEVSIFVLIAYNVIYMMVWFLQEVVCENLDPGIDKKSKRYLLIEKFLRKKHIVYCANGMKHSINFILSSFLLLLTWVLYFGSHLNGTPGAKNVLRFGTWTCVSFLTCSFLWLIKTCVLLSWEARSVYKRLHSRIIEGGKQLYFLGVIGRHDYDIFNLLYECGKQEVSVVDYVEELKRLRSDLCNTLFPTRAITLDARYQKKSDKVDVRGIGVTVKKLCEKKKKRVQDDLLTQQRNTMYCAQLVAGYFFTAKKTLLQEKFTSDIIQKFKNYGEDNDKSKDWEDFKNQLHEFVDSGKEILFEKRLSKWVERASNNCIFLANTLSSAKEVVDCLNKIISCLLIAATFILWLLLTGLATTKVLLLIVSPLLAATFVFGDTCKTLFQGIIFVFVVHPFYVGDLCVIDGNMMEVRTIGIWKTTLSKVSTQEEVIYSNSELFNKSIINHKTNFDWNDYVELDVSSLDKKTIKILKNEIEEYLDWVEDKFIPGYNSVEVLTNGDNVKLIVYFRHRVNLRNHTYFECLKEKRKLRSGFVLHAEDLVDQYKNREQRNSDGTTDVAQDD
ncbi:mechanosensitive ion channel protein 10 isoform X2 [Spinacia oleracea]|uniref:Mechanosensitive ion channel protein 10 isoform X2 n=2 Tax=Spinacia oleracea TaxID=3562 RepID=A0ABM3RVZ6_SPIOL|nr:mechanosensitive ion channel protein 10-like isoform X2 [Spinacia oleracea]